MPGTEDQNERCAVHTHGSACMMNTGLRASETVAPRPGHIGVTIRKLSAGRSKGAFGRKAFSPRSSAGNPSKRKKHDCVSEEMPSESLQNT